MLVIKRLTPDLARNLPLLSGDCFISDETVVRITRTGFQLSYLPLKETRRCSYPAPACADPVFLAEDLYSDFFAAYQSGQYAGAVAATQHESGWAEILDLRVDVSFRRQGIGRMLLSSCDQFARRKGLHGLRLTCPDSHSLLCQFLEHTGFTLQGMDRYALAFAPGEREKPRTKRVCQLSFYRPLNTIDE